MLDVIQQVIRGEYIPGNQLEMVANDTDGRQGKMTCRICAAQGDEMLLCSFDRCGNNHLLFPYFKEEQGFTSMCDYILFVEDDESMFVFLIELKDSSHRAKRQTGIARTFAEFIIGRILEIKGKSNFPKSIKYRRVGVKTSHTKMTTKGYDTMGYDNDGYVVLPDYHNLYIRKMKELAYPNESII